MKKVRGAALFIIAALGLAGCGSQEKTAEVSSLSFGKEGEIVHQIVGSFEEDYYDLEGLESLAAQRVEEYCAEHGEESVYLESVKEKNGEISILFHYATQRITADLTTDSCIWALLRRQMRKAIIWTAWRLPRRKENPSNWDLPKMRMRRRY